MHILITCVLGEALTISNNAHICGRINSAGEQFISSKIIMNQAAPHQNGKQKGHILLG